MKEINKKVEIMLSKMEFEESEKETLEIMLKDMLVEQEEQEEIKVEEVSIIEQKKTIKILLNEDNMVIAFEEISNLEGSIEIEDLKIINRIKEEGLLDINDNFHFKYLDGKLSKKKATKEAVLKIEVKESLEERISELEEKIKILEGNNG